MEFTRQAAALFDKQCLNEREERFFSNFLQLLDLGMLVANGAASRAQRRWYNGNQARRAFYSKILALFTCIFCCKLVCTLWLSDDAISAHKQRVLILHYYPPNLSFGSDRRLLHIIEVIMKMNVEIFFVSLQRGRRQDRAALEKIIRKRALVADLNKVPEIRSLIRPKAILIPLWFWSTPNVFEQMAPGLRLDYPNVPLVMISDDCHYIRESRLAQSVLYPHVRSAVTIEEIRKRELRAYNESDFVTFISSLDRDQCTSEFHFLKTKASMLRTSPVPVLQRQCHTNARVKRAGLVFLGNGKNPTNLIGVHEFLVTTWPAIHSYFPDLEFHVIGENLQTTNHCLPAEMCREYEHLAETSREIFQNLVKADHETLDVERLLNGILDSPLTE